MNALLVALAMTCVTPMEYMERMSSQGGITIKVEEVHGLPYDHMVFSIYDGFNVIGLVVEGCMVELPILFRADTFTGERV